MKIPPAPRVLRPNSTVARIRGGRGGARETPGWAQIPYRLTSGAALGALALLFVPSPRAVGWGNACGNMDDQFDMTRKLVMLVWLGAYVVFVRQGLRNRSGPKWLAIAGVLALFL